MNEQAKHVAVAERISDTAFNNQCFSSTDFTDLHYAACDFSHAIFENCSFHQVLFERCILDAASFRDCRFNDCTLLDTTALALILEQCTLLTTNSIQSQFSDMRVERSKIGYWTFTECAMSGLLLIDSEIHHLTVHGMPPACIRMRGGTLHDPVWFDCSFVDSVFEQMHIYRQVMGNSNLQRCVYRDVRASSLTWQNCVLDELSMQAMEVGRFSFHRSTLNGCDFIEQDLSEALFAEARIARCDFSQSILTGAVFDGAVLEHCQLRAVSAGNSSWNRVQMRECVCQDARFVDSSMHRAFLHNNDFSNTAVTGCQLHGAQMSDNRGLEPANAQQENPRLAESDAWYGRFQPGAQHISRGDPNDV